MLRKTLFLGTIVLAAAVAAGYAAVSSKPEQAAATSAQPVVEFAAGDLYVVAPRPLEQTLAITGTLAALNEATVKAKLAGELVAVPVREGQAVRRGEVLARIDPTEAQAKVAARQADVQAARAQLVWAEKNRAMQRALLERKFISQNAFDNVQSSYDVAVAKLRAAEAELALARKSLGDAVLTAPMAGIVAQRHAQPGERVAIDAKVVTLVDLSRLELEAAVPAAEIGKVRIGQPVEFTVDGFGARTFAGRIERINPATTAGSRSISVYAVLENPDGALRSGLFAQGRAILERVPGALLVPASAVREQAGETFVYVIENDRVGRRAVKVGGEDRAGRVQVLQGLQAGDTVVRNNLGALAEGAIARRPADSSAGSD